MNLKSTLKLTIAVLALFALSFRAHAQEDVPKLEIGAQFSSIDVDDDPMDDISCAGCDTFVYRGVGGRFTYNVNDHLAVETEVNFFLNENNKRISRRVGGRPVQALFGVKAGRRFKQVGLFGKVRPGVISFSRVVNNGLGGTLDPVFARRTHFNLDVGGVFEVYPSRNLVFRVDAGDTIVRYGEEHEVGVLFTRAGDTRHSFQFNTGVGFRF